MKHRTIKLEIIFIKEGNKIIAFSPALDLSTCANTFDKAKKRFEEIVKIFFEEVEQMKTLDEVLTELGWSKNKKASWIPPHIIANMRETFQIPCQA